jgi:hypothetical protein
MGKELKDMSVDELKSELKRLRDSLCDVEDLHAFTYGKTSIHMSGEKAQEMQKEFEEECRAHRELIAKIEEELRERGK